MLSDLTLHDNFLGNPKESNNSFDSILPLPLRWVGSALVLKIKPSEHLKLKGTKPARRPQGRKGWGQGKCAA